MSRLVKCELCEGRGYLRDAGKNPITGKPVYQTIAKYERCAEEFRALCPLCKGKRRITVERHTGFILMCGPPTDGHTEDIQVRGGIHTIEWL